MREKILRTVAGALLFAGVTAKTDNAEAGLGRIPTCAEYSVPVTDIPAITNLGHVQVPIEPPADGTNKLELYEGEIVVEYVPKGGFIVRDKTGRVIERVTNPYTQGIDGNRAECAPSS
ncbi:MAG: hypothetical protein WAX38_03560 [Minisyncoccia bacterium]